MAKVSSSQIPEDPWDQPTTSLGPRPPVPPPTSAVRDDWEDEDDDEIEGGKSSVSTKVGETTEKNRKLWEAANAKVAAPMPTLLSSRTSSIVPPPPAAFQPTLRILKRPQGSTPSQDSPPTLPLTGESLQDREARYAAARERIFGAEAQEGGNKRPSEDSGNGKSSPLAKAGDTGVKILREPKAPEPPIPGKRGQSVGFKRRGGKASSLNRPPATTS